MVAEGNLGDWGQWYWTPNKNWLACGVALQSQKEITLSEETATNAIDIDYCDTFDWNKKKLGGHDTGYAGEWDFKLCPKNMYISAMEM